MTFSRRVMRLVAQLFGLGAGVGAAAVAKAEPHTVIQDNLKNLIEAMGIRRLQDAHSDETILEQFHSAQTGSLMLYYQLFWPIFIRSSDQIRQRVEAFHELYERKRGEQEKYKRWHRVRVLPAVAAAHALGQILEEEDREAFQSLIVQTHDAALDPGSDPHREVLEILWQNMTAALIRNPENWSEFEAGSQLIAQAEAVCRTFLAGEAILLHAALTAWQFLLTYERALQKRNDQARLLEVHAAKARVEGSKTQGFPWLSALDQIYEKRLTYGQMLPQLTEVVMGRQQYKGVVDFFILARLQSTHNNLLLAEGNLHSPYIPTQRAGETAQGSLTFLANYGVKPSDWSRLKSLAENGGLFSKDTITYLDDAFRKYETTFSMSEFEKGDNVWLSKWIPFRRIDEEEAFRRAHDRQHSLKVLALIVGTAFTPTHLVDAWGQIAEDMVTSELQKRALPFNKQGIMDETNDRLYRIAPAYKEELEYVQEHGRMGAHSYRGVNLARKHDKYIVETERLSSARRVEQESVGEGISSKSEDASVFHDGRETKRSLGRGEHVMHIESPPEAIEELVDFNDPPLWGQDPKELEKMLGVKIEVLHEKPDKWLGAYLIRVCGSFAGVSALRKAFLAHPPPGLSRKIDS